MLSPGYDLYPSQDSNNSYAKYIPRNITIDRDCYPTTEHEYYPETIDKLLDNIQVGQLMELFCVFNVF